MLIKQQAERQMSSWMQSAVQFPQGDDDFQTDLDSFATGIER